MRATLREHIDPVHLQNILYLGASKGDQLPGEDQHIASASPGGKKEPMTVLYGSNSGTCEALARSLARTAGSRGYKVKVDTLDAAVGKVPKGEPVVMVSSSYEGQPPDNATHFVAWLSSLKDGKALEGVKYAVYGCGNRKFTMAGAYFLRNAPILHHS